MVQNQGSKVFVAAALGAFIGALVGLQFTPLFWWVGMLVGGSVGYVAYDPKAVVSAVPQAASVARRSLSHVSVVSVDAALWLGGEALKGVKTILGILLCIPLAILIGMSWGVGLVLAFPSPGAPIITTVCVAGFISFMAGLVIATIEIFSHPDEERIARIVFRATIFRSPIGVALYYVPRWTWALIRGATFAAVFLWRTIRWTVKFIHSDLRMLCGVDAAIGAGIGIFAHNPLLGAVAGGLFGVLNYELVSKRLLKLVPR